MVSPRGHDVVFCKHALPTPLIRSHTPYGGAVAPNLCEDFHEAFRNPLRLLLPWAFWLLWLRPLT